MTNAKGQPAHGIIPFQPIEIDPRDALIHVIATMISDAVTGPEIGVLELAEMIVDTVRENDV
ncbi:hypothetical protein NKJ51_23830 [Mesorhizobium sp. M0134]|uniref:hypothetical protein n=1 Tax=Mesorhizobium sp. M0134 TaxID=2956889 RepID=UPI00333D58DA